MKNSKLSIQAANIDLIVYDFDGVMTDNRVIVFRMAPRLSSSIVLMDWELTVSVNWVSAS